MDASATPHRTVLQSEIAQLEERLLFMGARADRMIGMAIESIADLDSQKAFAVLQMDDEIDQLDLELEQRCLRLLALQQPMASDLREIGTVMKVITDIERVGDLAVDIAKAGLKIERELGETGYVDLRHMGHCARSMFRESITAFVRRDLEIVRTVVAEDDQVDELYRQLRGQIFNHMQSYPSDVVAAGWMLMAVHHLERVADHAVNVAERVAFMITGKFEQLAASHRTPEPGAESA